MESGRVDTSKTQLQDYSPSAFGTCTSVKCGGDKLVSWAQTPFPSEMAESCQCFLHVKYHLLHIQCIHNQSLNL